MGKDPVSARTSFRPGKDLELFSGPRQVLVGQPEAGVGGLIWASVD